MQINRPTLTTLTTLTTRSSPEVVMSTMPASLAALSEVESELNLREIEAVKRILFFDGVCGLCHWSVDFVLIRDVNGKIQFAPLQGETAHSLLAPAEISQLNSVVFWNAGRVDRKSSAVVRVLWQLSLGWQLVGTLLGLIPLPLRNLGYDLVARNRYALFGKKPSCRVPRPEERIRFLP